MRKDIYKMYISMIYMLYKIHKTEWLAKEVYLYVIGKENVPKINNLQCNLKDIKN